MAGALEDGGDGPRGSMARRIDRAMYSEKSNRSSE